MLNSNLSSAYTSADATTLSSAKTYANNKVSGCRLLYFGTSVLGQTLKIPFKRNYSYYLILASRNSYCDLKYFWVQTTNDYKVTNICNNNVITSYAILSNGDLYITFSDYYSDVTLLTNNASDFTYEIGDYILPEA